MRLQRLAWAAMLAAGLALAACGGGDDSDEANTPGDVQVEEGGSTQAEGGDTAQADSASAPEPPAAPVGFAGTWIEDDTDPDRIELLDGGSARTNEPSLGEGRWEDSNGELVLTFQNGNIRITGRMDGDTLVLTAPNGETGRFNRSGSGSGSSGGRGDGSGGGNSSGQGGGSSSGGGKPD